MKQLRDLVNERTEQYCNHCVVNQYRDGSDHIGLHKDKVRKLQSQLTMQIKDFQPGTSVMTISFGAARLFRLKNCTTNEIIDITLQPGSVFILGGKTNSEWKHSIVKRSPNEVSEPRIRQV